MLCHFKLNVSMNAPHHSCNKPIQIDKSIVHKYIMFHIFFALFNVGKSTISGFSFTMTISGDFVLLLLLLLLCGSTMQILQINFPVGPQIVDIGSALSHAHMNAILFWYFLFHLFVRHTYALHTKFIAKL